MTLDLDKLEAVAKAAPQELWGFNYRQYATDFPPSTALALIAQAREVNRLRAALIAFADHFGPLEDNYLLNDECRRCFALAREALKETGNATTAAQ